MFELGGKKICAIYVNNDQSELVFQHDERQDKYTRYSRYVTEGDCCSETWFADIIGVKNLLAKDWNDIVLGVEILDFQLPQDPQDGRSRQEFDAVYGYRIKTKHGECDIIFRNSSNGYYGGSVALVNANDFDLNTWTKIEDDWSA